MSTAVEEVLPQRAEPQPIPEAVKKKLERGRSALRKTATKRRMWYRYWRGDTYAEINGRGQLINLPTLSANLGGGRVPQRIRNKYPFIAMIVQAKVSAATQRVPSYEILPSKVDPNSQQAAELAEKVALYGYDKWRLRRKTVQAVEHALVGGEAFAYPYWDDSVGPFVTVSDPLTGEIADLLGQGEVGVLILSANEVFWEPGCDFEESRWYAIERAVPIDVVKEMPGYLGGDLKPDATESEAPKDAPPDHLALVTEYLCRPSAKDRDGVRITMAGGRRILEDGPYPCQDHEGNVIDEPVLLRLSYIVESDDRDRGLVEQLVDLQRTIQDCWNKLLEWKNRCLNPQMIAPRGSNMALRDDTLGATWYYNAIAGLKPEWERPPQIPRELFELLDKAIEHMRALSADVDVQPDPRLTSATAQQAVEQAQLRWQSFLGDLAEFHSRLMRRCLYLVQRHYTEARDVKIQGTFGPDLEEAFRGADLLGQADVRVSPDSLASKSRQAIINETILFADRGWITAQAAMAVIQGGTAENLWKGWLNDVSRAQFLIQTIKRGEAAVMALPMRPVYPGEPPPADPTGQPLYPGPTDEPMVPSWMPRPFDKAAIQREVFEWWMKTTDWDRLDSSMQHVAILIYQALVDLDNKQQAEQAQAMVNQAQALGMGNAARPQAGPGLPSQRNAGTTPAPFNQENQSG